MTGMKSTNSNKTFSADELQSIYQRRFGGRIEYRDKVWRALIKNFFQKYVRPTDVVLDLGAGYGEFINHITCGTKYAMDLNPDTAHRVGKDVEIIAQDCAEPWPLSEDSLDIIFTSNFFEHLPDTEALARTLREAMRCLKSGGRIIATGPNIKYALGAYWDFIDHHIPLTERSLAEAFTHQGFSIETCIDKFLPFTMAYGPQYPTIFLALYLRLPLAWRILGKQFLVIGKKA